MSFGSQYNLNQRLTYLESIIQQIVPSLPLNLDKILTNGDNAGANDIDMNNNDILNVNNIDLLTINGSVYPPPSTPSSSVFNYKAHTNSQAPPVPNGQIEWNNLTQASATQIYLSHLDDDGDDIQVLLSALPLGTIFIIQDQALGSNYQRWTITSVSSVLNQYITFGVSLLASTHSFSNNDPVLFIVQSVNQNLEQVLGVGNSAGVYDIDMNNNDILQVNNIDVSTINGSAYPPAVEDLSTTLLAGNTANNSIILTDGVLETMTLQKKQLSSANDDGTGILTNATLKNDFGGQQFLSFGSSVPFGYNNSLSVQLASGGAGCGISHLDSFPTPSDFTISTDQNLALSSSKNLTLTADNVDLSSAGTLIIPSPIATNNLQYTQPTSNFKINQGTTGGVANPIISLNQNDTASGACNLTFYKNTFTNGNTIGEMSFRAKTNITGNPEREYARIGGTIRSNTTGNVDGAINFQARINDTLTELMRINGQDSQVEIYQPLDMNNNNIVNVATGIFTAVSSTTCSIGTGNFSTINASSIQDTAGSLTYFPSVRTFVSSLFYTFPTPNKLFHDFFIYSNGIAPSLTTSNKSPAPQGFCQASTSITFNNRTILADNNQLYWWDALSSAWSSFYAFNGTIRTMCISDDGYLWVGGDFVADVFSSVVYNYIARFDNSLAVQSPIVWNNVGGGGVGFSNPVYTLTTNNNGNGYIYAGGFFTHTGGNFLQVDYFACIVSGSQDIYQIDGVSGTGFNSPVLTISTQGTKIFIGGQFSTGTANSGGFGSTTFNYPYGMIWDSNGYQSTLASGSEMIYIGGNPSSLNSNVESSAYTSDNGIVWIGGSFTNVDMSGENYLFGCDLNNPTNIVSTGYTFNNPVPSVKGSTGFVSNNLVIAIDTANNYEIISLVSGGSFVLGNGFLGSQIAGVEYDQNDNTIDLFFTANSTILSYNPSQATTIDLNSQGIFFIYNGVSYQTSCILNGNGAWFEGVCINTSPFTYNITNKHNTNLN